MLNQIQENPFVIDVPITSAVSPGDVVIDGGVIGIAIAGGASGTTIAVLLSGIVQIAASNSEAFTFGEAVYWDTGDSEVNSTASGNTFLGFAANVKASSSSVANIFLSPLHPPAAQVS